MAVCTEDDERVAESVEQQDGGRNFAHLSERVVQLTASGVAPHLETSVNYLFLKLNKPANKFSSQICL